MKPSPLAAIVLLAALAAAGCGGESGDLLAIEVRGAPGSPARTIVVTNDGRASCTGGPVEAVTSGELIDAREAERELTELVEEDRSFDTGGTSGRRYTARMLAGVVRWPEDLPSKPEVLPKTELLALRLGRRLCR